MLIEQGARLNKEWIQKIVNIKASLNTGLAENLNKAFPNTIPSQRLEDSNIPQGNKINPEWMAGFCTGESNFFITVQKSKSKIGFTTSLRFSIAQHSRDLFLLESFAAFFNCGYVTNYKNRLICEFIVTRIDHIVEYVIPFFEKNPVVGSKYSNFIIFKKAALIIKNKEHLKRLNSSEKHKKHLANLNASLEHIAITAKPVVVLDTITGETIEFRSMTQAAKHFSVHTESIRRHIKANKLLLNKYKKIKFKKILNI